MFDNFDGADGPGHYDMTPDIDQIAVYEQAEAEVNASIPEGCVGCPSLQIFIRQIATARIITTAAKDIDRAEEISQTFIDRMTENIAPDETPDDIADSMRERFIDEHARDVQSQILMAQGQLLDQADTKEQNAKAWIGHVTDGCDGVLKARVPGDKLGRASGVVIGLCRSRCGHSNPMKDPEVDTVMTVTVRNDTSR